ncbi:hypothetical protein HOI83_01710 [Candidatus Uhrbacteria bacterium]|jgi:magnesium transporter|nr:hypothetical protein [Candidatus Uhrbacteria bacterium]
MPRRKTPQRVKRGPTEWTYLTRPPKSELQALGKKFKLGADHLDALMTESHRSRLFDSEDYILLILIHPQFEDDSDDVVLKELDIIMTSKQVITIQKSSLPGVRTMFKEVSKSKSHKIMSHPATLVSSILHELVSDVYGTLDDIAERLDDMEQGILHKKHVLEDILTMQTNIIDIQKAIENQSIMLDRFTASLTKTTASKIHNQYNDLQMHLKEIQTSLRMEQMTAETLHRTHETVLNYRTNSQIRLLTSLSLLVLPATLLAGMFGMNVQFPLVANIPINFWMIVGLMAVSGVTVYIIGKAQK